MQIVIDTFKNSNNPALLNYATVKRSRQKIQEHNPNLRSEEQIKKDLAEMYANYYGSLYDVAG